MTARAARSLKSQLTWWFAAALLALFATAGMLGWLYARTTERQYALLTLKLEVEQAAAYIAETGRTDAAEFDEAEHEPIPLWLRAVRDGVVVKASPGAPEAPVLPPEGEETVATRTFRSGGTTYMQVRHRVGGGRGDVAVEAIGSLAPLIAEERRLGGALLLAGVLLIPIAALGGRWLAARALQPVEGLVETIRGLDPAAIDRPITPPGRAVQEVEVLTAAFNELLGRLQGSMEAMRRFTADASHEIRNPLSVLQSGLEIALRRERSPEQYRTLLRENLQEIERLHAVLEGLLALTRGGVGRDTPLRREPIDLAELVSATLDGFELVAAERGVGFRRALEPGAIVEGDPALLRLVVFNLVDNALKHGPAGEPIDVTLARDGERLRLGVADRGAGIPAEVRARLFERFNRPAGAAGGVGGLGLSVVLWVTELHGGRVRLLEAERGAHFEVLLPAHAAERGAA